MRPGLPRRTPAAPAAEFGQAARRARRDLVIARSGAGAAAAGRPQLGHLVDRPQLVDQELPEPWQLDPRTDVGEPGHCSACWWATELVNAVVDGDAEREAIARQNVPHSIRALGTGLRTFTVSSG